MREPSRFETWYGRDAPPAQLRVLRAGPLSAVLDGIDLRYVRVADLEVVRRLFVAVRDPAWGTVRPSVSDVAVDDLGDRFEIAFEAYHESGELRFRWRGSIRGDSEGAIEARMDGVAESEFEYNRIGFCVLHPSEHAGRPYRTVTPDGEGSGTLPDLIGKQRIEAGKLHPLFPSFRRLEIDAADDVRVRLDFEGDLFEMEDQRNWTDASFKTYSTQIALGWPWQAKAGQPIVQTIRLTAVGNTRARGRTAEAVQVELRGGAGRPLPPFGLGQASHGQPPGEHELELLSALRPDHLRVDLDLTGRWREPFELAADEARALEAGLELALGLGDDPRDELDAFLVALAGARPRVDRVIVLRAGETVTDTRWVRLAREALGSATARAAFVGGTDLWFTELNREPAVVDGLDAVAYSTAATVHADDDISVRETPSTHGATVRSAIALYDGLPVVVSPVTIRPRSWPFGEVEDPRGLPFQVDQRQCSLLGAGWTTASLKSLLEAGPASVTYFETTGWRGVVETAMGSPAPERFPSRAGQAFPLYHVLADLGEWRRGARLVESRSAEPFVLEAFAVEADGDTHVLIANLTPEPRRGTVGPLAGSRVKLRSLDEETAGRAGDDPAGFRRERERRDVRKSVLELELPPYAVVRVDV